MVLPEAAKVVTLSSRGMERNGGVVVGRLTKLPNIRGPSFASRRPAGVGLAGIASN